MGDDLLERLTGGSIDRSDRLPRPERLVEPDPESIDDHKAFGYLRGVRDRAIYLELRKKTGESIAIAYAWIDRVEFDPSTGITLCFGGQKVVIQGRNLNAEVQSNVRLYQAILRQRVPWVQEMDSSRTFDAIPSEISISQIEISNAQLR